MGKENKLSLQFPNNIIVIGKRYSGKSNLIRNIIDPHMFDEIFVITHTENTGNLKAIQPDDEYIIHELSEEFLDELIKIHKENKLKTLLLFDDFIGSFFDVRRSTKMNLLATSGRNYGISLLFSSQDWTSVPIKVRRNAEYIFILKANANTKKQLVDDITPGNVDRKEFDEMIKNVNKSDKHDFLLLRDRENDIKFIDGTSVKVFF